MRILITGATGHTGACLVRELLKEQHEVVSLSTHDNPLSLAGLDIEHRLVDIRDIVGLEQASKGADLVYHLAAKISITGDPDGSVHDINVNGTNNVIKACLKNDVPRMIHVSSVHAFNQEPFHEPLDEKRSLVTCQKKPAYDRSKATAEKVLKKHPEQDIVCISPSGVLGPYEYYPSLMGKAVHNMLNGNLPYTVAGGFNWVDVRDVVQTLIQAASKGQKGEKYIVGGSWHSIFEIGKMAASVANVPPPRFTFPLPLAEAFAPISMRFNQLLNREVYLSPEGLFALRSNKNLNDNKARKELNHTSRPILETLHDTHQWFQNL